MEYLSSTRFSSVFPLLPTTTTTAAIQQQQMDPAPRAREARVRAVAAAIDGNL
ncbi:hypothetical protein INS49_000340 [Diaporthe citri]|uniref:uncharacterized protein n=1 Tax=Diaporthe citri TaxID=83186 RepID=UPI001C82372F|nr:uncharacterized protein INS49_000340 [Diaporthe citri]KAG6366164.1 hypothetical protein INS49_000340 [Diaporthe citri]